MMKKIILAGLISTFLISSTMVSSAQTTIVNSMEFQGEVKELYFSDAVSIMLKDNPAIKVEKLNIDQARVSSDRLVGTISTIENNIYRNTDNSLESKKTLETSKLNKEYLPASAKRNYDAVVAKLTSELEQSYYGMQQAQQSVNIYKDNLDVSKDILEKTKKKFDLGLVSKQDVLNAEYSFIKATNDYNLAINSLKKAKMALNIKLGFDVMSEIKLKDELKFAEYNPGNISEAVYKALSTRSDIKAAEYKYFLQEITTNAVKAQNKESYDYEIEKLNLEKAAKDLDTIKKSIEMEVRNNYLDVLQKQEEIKANQKMLENASEALKIVRIKFDTGMGVMTDVQSAQIEYLKSQLALSTSILNYELAVSTYKDSISVGRVKF